MTDRFNKVRKCLKSYIDGQLLSGQSLMTIIEGLKGGGPLPAGILLECAGEDQNYIRSRAQILVSEYLARQHGEHSAVIPEDDILVPSLDKPPTL